MSKFNFAPGIPGYGTVGKAGIDGSVGLGMYFTNLNGVDDHITIKNKILSNTILWSTTSLPNNRKYQTGDAFVDKQGRVYQIMLDTSYPDRFIYTGSYLNTSNLFVFLDGLSNDVGALRYYNQYIGNTYAIDSVFTNNAIDYTANPATIYGIKPVNFEKIEYSDIAPQSKGYNPFTVFTSGTNANNSIALVRDTVNNIFRLGNLDADGSIRNVDLTFDVNDLIVNRDKTNPFATNTAQGNILSNRELKINNLVDPVFNANASSFTWLVGTSITDASIYWNLQDITGTGNMASIVADLYLHQDFTISNNTYNFSATLIDLSTMVFHGIDVSGMVKISGLTSGKTYSSYVRVYQNGWQRDTNRIKIYPGLAVLLDVSTGMFVGAGSGLGGVVGSNFDATNASIGETGGILNLDISSNVTCNITTDYPYSWVHISKPNSINTLTKLWDTLPHDSSISLDAFSTQNATRIVNVTVTGGTASRSIQITQNGPQSPTEVVSLTTAWSGASSPPVIGYNNFVYLYTETSPGNNDFTQYVDSWAPTGSPTTGGGTSPKLWQLQYANYKFYVGNIVVVIGGVAAIRTQTWSNGGTTGVYSNAFTVSQGNGHTETVTFNGHF